MSWCTVPGLRPGSGGRPGKGNEAACHLLSAFSPKDHYFCHCTKHGLSVRSNLYVPEKTHPVTKGGVRGDVGSEMYAKNLQVFIWGKVFSNIM